ncbi:hypothetical protein F8388_018426 [Cannabis sativa]|uniref:Reverse transcriptase zinc-binding domain-containing protein n=1 Tax=Cannabis sativa TaxID=3483 RepID=A0A7J6F4W6_CANSA|nr:hypothetical protein F8388_018426 [Cannabis sativa]
METSGLYIVKSAYKFLQSGGNWLHLQDDSNGQKLWQFAVPPKVHHFLWRACSGCLPTKVQLNTKHVNVDLLCLFCNMEYETIYHVLLGCSFSRSYWFLSAATQPAAGSYQDFVSWFFELLDGSHVDIVVDVAMISWNI